MTLSLVPVTASAADCLSCVADLTMSEIDGRIVYSNLEKKLSQSNTIIFTNYTLLHKIMYFILTFTTVFANLADDKLIIVSLFSTENRL